MDAPKTTSAARAFVSMNTDGSMAVNFNGFATSLPTPADIITFLAAIAAEVGTQIEATGDGAEDAEDIVVTPTRWFPASAPDRGSPIPPLSDASMRAIGSWRAGRNQRRGSTEPRPFGSAATSSLSSTPLQEQTPTAGTNDTGGEADAQSQPPTGATAGGASALAPAARAGHAEVDRGRGQRAPILNRRRIAVLLACVAGVSIVTAAAWVIASPSTSPAAPPTSQPKPSATPSVLTPTTSSTPPAPVDAHVVTHPGARSATFLIATPQPTAIRLQLTNQRGRIVETRSISANTHFTRVTVRLPAGAYTWRITGTNLTPTAGKIRVTAPPAPKPSPTRAYVPPTYVPPAPKPSPKPPPPTGGPVGQFDN